MFSSVFLALAPVCPSPPQGSPYQLNEIHARLDGLDDQEFVELRVPGGTVLDGLMLLVVDGEALQAGILDLAVALEGLQAPDDGYFVIGSDTVPNVDLALGAERILENGTQTIYLVETNDIGAIQALVGLDVDPNSDFQTELPGLATILDSVALIDEDVAAGWDTAYDDAPSFGPSNGFIPSGIFRAGDGNWCNIFLDSDTTNSLDQPRTPGAPNQLCPRGELQPLNPEAGDYFGWSLAIASDRIAAGAIGRGDRGSTLVLDPSGQQIFELETTFNALGFGWDIAMDDERLVIGTQPNFNLAGQGAELYDLATGNRLRAFGFNSNSPAELGTTVDLDADLVVIGAEDIVELYDVNLAFPVHTFAAPNPEVGFGSEVAISNDFVAIGAPSDSASGTNAGTVYVYDANSGNLVRVLTASDSVAGLGFGTALAAEGTELLVGTRLSQGAYRFDLTSGAELSKYSAEGAGAGFIGSTLDFSEDLVIFGSSTDSQTFSIGGSITVVDKQTGQTLLKWAPPSLEPGDQFGFAVAIDGSTLAASAPQDSDHGSASGTVFTLESDLGTNFCGTNANSTGSAGRIYGFGSSRITANDLVLTAAPLPADQAGLFVYGPSSAAVPFGDGVRCVGGAPLSRLQLRTVRDQGYLQHTFDNNAPPTAAGQVTAGSTWYFQAWFRDPAAGGSGFNLSDGLELTFQP